MQKSLSYILDSSLIFQTNFKKFQVKIIDCGTFKQLYFYSKNHYKKLDHDNLVRVDNNTKNTSSIGYIEYRNLVRSKNNMSRLVMANYKSFKTFVTLTFKENITSIETANKKFNSFITYIKKSIRDFKYICVPEFQKRGAVHYHLLTNIDYTNFDLFCKDEKKLYSPTTKTWEVGRPVLKWVHGYSLAKNIVSDEYDLIGYMAKYMLKDFDNRLFGKRRYLNSHNLIKPKELYIDYDNTKDIALLSDILYNYEVRYEGSYNEYATNSPVIFQELELRIIDKK